MNDSPNRREVIVGLFVFVGLVFLIAGILLIGNLRETFKSKMEVISLFDDVGGLQKGNVIGNIFSCCFRLNIASA